MAAETLPTLPFARPDPLTIAPLFLQLQREAPICRVRTRAGDLAWLVTRYDDVKALLLDERLARSHPDPARAARVSNAAFLGGPMGDYATEQEDHARMRRLLAPAFSAKRMQALAPHVRALVAELFDAMAAQMPPVDFHEAVSFPLPVLVICELLGVPFEDRGQFRALSERVADLRDREAAQAALTEFGAYMHDVIERKRQAPGEDVLSDLIAARDERGALSERELVGYAAGLLFAGHETTVARLDFGTLLQFARPGARELLERDPEAVGATVEEILRLAAPGGDALPRYARADIAVGGVTIRAGDAVLLALGAANRDERAFACPDQFIAERQPNPHLTFGHGRHYCLGASLARVELRAVFGALFVRFPTLRLAVPPSELRLREHMLTGGLAALPVTW